MNLLCTGDGYDDPQYESVTDLTNLILQRVVKLVGFPQYKSVTDMTTPILRSPSNLAELPAYIYAGAQRTPS